MGAGFSCTDLGTCTVRGTQAPRACARATSHTRDKSCCSTMVLSVAWIALCSGCLQAGTSFTVAPPGPTASTYTRRAHTDCDAGGCRTFRRVGECGSPPAYPTMTPCNISVLEALCDAAAGCAGFNTNGWLQAHIDPASLKNTSSCDLYVRDAGPASAYVFPAAPPGPPLPVREDYHYPAEAPNEAERHPAPAVLRVNYTPRGPCTVELGAVDNVSKMAVPSRFNGWELLSCVLADDHDEPQLVMQRTFRRWSMLVFAGTSRAAVSFRSSVGAAAEVCRPGPTLLRQHSGKENDSHRFVNWILPLPFDPAVGTHAAV
jgi:hypothetical protein